VQEVGGGIHPSFIRHRTGTGGSGRGEIKYVSQVNNVCGCGYGRSDGNKNTTWDPQKYILGYDGPQRRETMPLLKLKREQGT